VNSTDSNPTPLSDHNSAPAHDSDPPVLLHRAWPPLFAAFLFLVPVIFLGAAFDPFKPVKLMLVRIFCAGAALAWLGGATAARKAAWLRTAADAPWALFLAWLGVCLFLADHKFLAFDALLEWACAATLFFAALQFFDSRKNIETALLGAMAAAPAVALLGLLELRGMDWFPWDYLLVNPWYSVFADFDSHGYIAHAWFNQFDGRISSTIGNPVYAAGFAVLLIPPALAMYLSARRPWRTAFCFTALACLAFILIATFTRSAWAACAAALLIFTAAALPGISGERRKTAALRAGALALAAGLMFVLFSFHNPVNTGRFTASERAVQLPGGADQSAMQRLLIWKTTWTMVADHPVRGAGMGQYIRQYPLYVAAFNHDKKWKAHVSFPDHAHNDILELWAETGTVGVLLFAAVLAAVFVRGAPRRAQAAQVDSGAVLLRAGLFAGLAGILLYSNFQFPFHVPSTAAYFWVFAGMLMALGEKTVRRRRVQTVSADGKSASGRALIAALAAVIFTGACWLAVQPVISHLLFGRGIAVENRFPNDPPETALQLLDTARATYAYEPEMCVEMMRALLARGHREELPEHVIQFYTGIVRHPNLGHWRPLWRGRLPDTAPTPPWGRAAPTKIFYYANTVRTANQCLAINPNDTRPWAALGRVHFEMRMPEESASAYDTALKFAPEHPEYLHAAGDAYMLMQDYETAANRLRRALDIAPDFLPALFSYGETLLKLGRFREAQALYRDAIGRDPKNPVLWKFLGKALSQDAQVTAARKAWERALAIDPNFLEAAGDLAVLLYNTEDIDKGIALLEDIIAKAPQGSGIQARAAYHLGEARLAGGNRDNAVSAFRRAVALSPDNPLFKQRLEEVLNNNDADRTP